VSPLIAAVHVIGDEAAQVDLRIDFTFTDLDQTWTVWVRRGVLNARRGASPDTQLTVSGPRRRSSARCCSPPLPVSSPRPGRSS
jgi:alkyl sulfatase BDS1-like metallo-beta-lactamase superfamily hydrolase